MKLRSTKNCAIFGATLYVCMYNTITFEGSFSDCRYV